MNKTKLFKLINELKENINKDLKDYPESRLYIQSWVIGDLNMIEYKAKGESYYPFGATYEYLYKDFEEHFICKNIDERIKWSTAKCLINTKNIDLVVEIRKTLLGE